MKYIITISFIFLCFTSFGQIRNDHKMHFLVGSTVGASVMNLPKMNEFNTWQKIYLGTLASASVGVIGEGYDLISGNGAVEGSDILWTALGGMVSSSINVLVIEKIPNRRKNKGRK